MNDKPNNWAKVNALVACVSMQQKSNKQNCAWLLDVETELLKGGIVASKFEVAALLQQGITERRICEGTLHGTYRLSPGSEREERES